MFGGKMKKVKCPRCKYRFLTRIGDVRPHFVTCTKCGHKWAHGIDEVYIPQKILDLISQHTDKDKH